MIFKYVLGNFELIREETNVLRNSVATKMKAYRCMVELLKPVTVSKLDGVSAMKEIEVEQQNPTRVPRRADLMREKVVHEITITPETFVEDEIKSDEDEKKKKTKVELVKTIQVDLKTSAGTYVKEFMHGDGGRTNPNIHTLLECEGASVISLDVLEVFLNWPRRIDRED
jgi:tRNA pseudouridine synthase 10